ncbi:hypothetical protein [Sorangium sp. So ce341]|uniref:hypothetical protein n=1 Tax=Sorangium sp. So ce341 TaxID=3133302 RepID=UPI003F60563C
MPPEHPSLRLLREVRRVERLARHFAEPVASEQAWDALQTFAASEADAPGWLDRRIVPRAHRPQARSYGDVVRFRRGGFFSTAPVPFTGVALREGGEVVAFRAMVRKDLAPVVLRFAVDRLWRSQGWRFPADLGTHAAFESLLELAFAGDPACRYRSPDGAALASDEGEVLVEAIDPPPWLRGDRVRLRWGPRHLGFYSERFGGF